MNLFSAPLQSITFDDIASSLGLNVPEDRRIPEGVKMRVSPMPKSDAWAHIMNLAGGFRLIPLIASLLIASGSLSAQSDTATHHTLKPTPKTVAWGYYDAKAAPVLRVKSGDTVEIQTLITNSPKRLEEVGVPPDQVEQSLRDITDQVKDKGPGGHILTGPIYIEGAEPGDVLGVKNSGHQAGDSLRLQRLRRGTRLSARRLSLLENKNHSAG